MNRHGRLTRRRFGVKIFVNGEVEELNVTNKNIFLDQLMLIFCSVKVRVTYNSLSVIVMFNHTTPQPCSDLANLMFSVLFLL